MALVDIFTSFILGLLTPLTAVCVLPLYPGFLAFLASKISAKKGKNTILEMGMIVTSGVILFMFILGLVFTTFLQVSLTKVIGIVSPIAFFILAIISIFLIFDIDIGKFFPKIRTPTAKNPVLNAFLFGFFFGAIIIPCNPLFIAALFTRAATMMSFAGNIANFVSFGIGIGFPLLVFSAISAAASTATIRFLTMQKRKINLVAGIIMLAISFYYIVFVFHIFG